MKKLILAVCVAVAGILFLSRSDATQFDIPQITYQSTTTTNGALILSTVAFVSPAYMHCLTHVTVSGTSAGQFQIVTATITASNTLSPATTSYVVVLSSGVPYDSQWSQYRAWCGPPNNQVTLQVSAGNYTISCEEFTTKGLAP